MKTLHNEKEELWIKEEMKRCLNILDRNMERFGEAFPSACAVEGKYEITPNHDWTNGFWTGMLWIAYEYSGQEKYKEAAVKNIKSFEQRLKDHYVLDHHDIGFLYSLSVVAGYRVLKDETLKPVILWAAKELAA
ncbi:MAG: glucuronyl hydrolase, partial [Lachnospiraceae bacterium]|nr:glucuronyl hydrolase [Lachnospiraceae bacterium]